MQIQRRVFSAPGPAVQLMQYQIEPEKNAALRMFWVENGYECSLQRMFKASEG